MVQNCSHISSSLSSSGCQDHTSINFMTAAMLAGYSSLPAHTSSLTLSIYLVAREDNKREKSSFQNGGVEDGFKSLS